MQSLREFFTSSSGLAPARQGLALGWVISALTGITVLLGAKETEAGRCGRTYEDCEYSAYCESINENEPISCCPVKEFPDCSFRRYPCYCTA